MYSEPYIPTFVTQNWPGFVEDMTKTFWCVFFGPQCIGYAVSQKRHWCCTL